MKLGLTTKQYPNHGTVLVPCDSQGNALGDNVRSIEVQDGIATVEYIIDDTLTFEGAKGISDGCYLFAVGNKEPALNVTFDTTDLQALLSDFIENKLPNSVREIVRDEMHKKVKEAAMSRVE